jgi:uncharacterized protein YcbX
VLVASVHVYPVKSGRGVAVDGSVVERAGLRHDRRWMVVGPDGVKMTARRNPKLLGLGAVPGETGALTLSAAGLEDLVVPVPPLPPGGPDIEVGISRLTRAVSAGAAAADWVSSLLGAPARLVWLDDPGRRSVAPEKGGRPGDTLSFADAGPLLLTTESSLRALQSWIGHSADGGLLGMTRFRPNVVVSGDLEPFVEDTWTVVRIGGLDYRFSEHCDRCVMTTYDPDTGVRGHEPLRTLAKHRRHDGKVWFGIRLIPLAEGRIAVGDRVDILDAGGRLS